MADIGFYHLTSTSLEEALPKLLLKSIERKWRVVVQVAEPARLGDLDNHLWTFADAEFLPHGSAMGRDGAPDPNADRQPIWLTTQGDNPNQANARFYVDGAFPAQGDAMDGYARIVLMFDGNDAGEVSDARAAWKALKADGHALTYWKQSPTGAWENASA